MWQTVGHDWATELLQRAIDRQHVAHTYLFTGPANIGKSTLAQDLAAALNCTGAQPPCGRCQACDKVTRRTHPDVAMIEPDAGKIKIEQVRRLQHDLALSPFEGRWRVCIVMDFQTATVEASNALLKMLEEPPARAVIVLTATDASLLLPTILSRCQVLPLRAISPRQLEDALVDRWNAPADLARVLARLSGGRIGWAIRAINDSSLLTKRKRRLDALRQIVPAGRAGRLQAAEQFSKREELPDILRLWQTWWWDLVLMRSGCAELITNLDYRDALGEQAEQCDLTRAEESARRTDITLQQLNSNVNPRLALEVLFLSWPQLSMN